LAEGTFSTDAFEVLPYWKGEDLDSRDVASSVREQDDMVQGT
jgi:hypothetical protein